MSDTEQKPEATSKPNLKSGSGKTNSSAQLIALVALVIVIAVSYLGYREYSRIVPRLNQVEQTLLSERNLAAEKQQALEIQLKSLNEQAQEQQQLYAQEISGLTNQLISSNERLQGLEGSNHKNWYLDEAYYLLRIANNRIVFLADLTTAISLIEQADELLAKIDDPNLFTTRQKLAADLQRLKSYPKVDRAGIAIRIGAMQSKVEALPVLRLMPMEGDVVETKQADPQTWYEHLANSFSKLGEQWFDVRHHGQNYKPILNNKDERLLRSNLMLIIQTTQFALLHQEGDLYQASLLQLKGRLETYFERSDSAVMAMIMEIERLLEVPTQQSAVAGIDSLGVLQNHLQQEAKQPKLPTKALPTDEVIEQPPKPEVKEQEKSEEPVKS